MSSIWFERIKKIFLFWLVLNVFTSLAFVIVAIREMTLRDFPEYDPFIATVPVNRFFDIFLPAIQEAIPVMGIITGIVVPLIYLSSLRWSKPFSVILVVIGFILVIAVLWIGVLWTHWDVLCKDRALDNADLFGCAPDPQLWHFYICIIWTLGIIFLSIFLWRKLLPKPSVFTS